MHRLSENISEQIFVKESHDETQTGGRKTIRVSNLQETVPFGVRRESSHKACSRTTREGRAGGLRRMWQNVSWPCSLSEPPLFPLSFRFASKISLYLHNRRFHMNLAQPMCETCGKQCRSKADLRSHIKSRHTETPKSKCDICGNLVKNMRKHKQIHVESALNIKCEICGHETTTFKYLRLHMKIHNDEKWVSYVICMKNNQRFPFQTVCLFHVWSIVQTEESAERSYESSQRHSSSFLQLLRSNVQ